MAGSGSAIPPPSAAPEVTIGVIAATGLAPALDPAGALEEVVLAAAAGVVFGTSDLAFSAGVCARASIEADSPIDAISRIRATNFGRIFTAQLV